MTAQKIISDFWHEYAKQKGFTQFKRLVKAKCKRCGGDIVLNCIAKYGAFYARKDESYICLEGRMKDEKMKLESMALSIALS